MTTAASSEPAATPRGSARPSTAPNRPQLSDEERRARFEANLAKTRTEEHCRKALAIAKLVGDGVVVCPKCRKPATRGKFKIHPDGGWKHFGSEGCSGDAVGVLQSIGIPTGDAVRVLLGLPTRTPIEIPENLAEIAAQFVGVKSKISLDVYNGVLVYGRKTGGVAAAQEFYGTWHIAPESVEAWGAVYIRDSKHFAQKILERFGEDKLIECGLFVPTQRGPYCLVSDKFPLIEPHRHPATGDVLYMQLRGSHAQHQRYLLHKADPDNVPYKGHEKFISLKGAPRAAQIGCGLDLIEKLPAGSDVYIVEGFKDGMAAHTLGLHAYAIPGVDFRPPAKICALLSQHNVWVTLDGDDAGQVGRDGKVKTDADGNVIGHTEGLLAYLVRHGVNARPRDIVPGLPMDVTDYLVATMVTGKRNNGVPCGCATCADMRTKHPDWFAGR